MPTFWDSLKALVSASPASSLDSKLLEKIANSFPLPVFVIDIKKDRFLWVSPGSLSLTELPLEDLLSAPVREFFEVHLSPSDTLLSLLQGQVSEAELETTFRTPHHSHHLQGYWIQLEEHLFVLIFQDVTELRSAQEELTQYAEELRQQLNILMELKNSLEEANRSLTESKEQMRMLAAVAAHTDNAVIITDAQGRILWVNRGFERLSGYTLEEAKGKVPGQLLQGPDTDPATVARIREKLRKKESFTEEILNYTKSGKPYWLKLYITPLTNELNEVTHFLAVELDITQEKERMTRMESQLRDVQQAQTYAARIFKRFLPDTSGLRAFFSDVQLWNVPLAGVGGDFYFYAPQESQVIVALGDSTGHGAAAALISVYALTSLWRSTRHFVEDLSELYGDLLEGIVASADDGSAAEGFELALLRYSAVTGQLEYLGARRPLWIARGGQLREVQGLREDVSAVSRHIPPLQTFSLQPGDRIYLFSDGLTDQLNPEGKKFSVARLRNFLQVNQYLSLQEQLAFLQQALLQWRGSDFPQTDDILFIALEV